MNAHVLGFELKMPSAISLADFFAHLGNSKAEVFAGYDRLLFINETPKYHIGLCLTTKDHRRFCELERQGNNFKINVREAAAGSSLIDFNFFAVRKTTGRGVYQWYFHSCHPKIFCRFCVGKCGSLQESRINQEIEANGGDNITDAAKLKIQEKYGGPLEWDILVRPESFETLIRQFQKISAFEFSFASLQPEAEKWFRPLRGVSQIVRHRVTFERAKSVKERSKAILSFLKDEKKQLAEASVAGRDKDGLDKIINLTQNPDSFGHYEFDALAKNMDFKPEDFADSVFMLELLKVADSYAKILDPKAK